MGGCRCTYRNCSLRTDGKTHMFHYPVFDKVRCHQWLTNAHKLEFLNLKVSQLKNRVVCQHHFKDDCFMNFKKDKLTFDAVPTEDGPYCDSSQRGETTTEQDESKVFSISLDDIENEYLTLGDKKANFSVKYGDFLTNCDLMDLDSLNSLNHITDNNQMAIKGLSELEPILNVPKVQVLSKRPPKSARPLPRRTREKRYGPSSRSILKKSCNNNTFIQGNLTENHDNTVDISHLIETPKTKEDKESLQLILNVSHVPVEFECTKSCDKIQENLDLSKSTDQSIDVRAFNESKLLNNQLIDVRGFDESNMINDQQFDVKVLNEPKLSNNNANKTRESKKIRIISEKKISEPVPLVGTFEPVSPTRILTFPNKKKFLNPNPTVEIPDVAIINTLDTSLVATDSSKDNLVLERPESEPINIITSSSRDNVSSQELVNEVINLIPNEGIPNNVSPQKIKCDVTNKSSDVVSPKSSFIKNKISPERLAAIAEKRKFNMKLRDIIEDCLDKLDAPEKLDGPEKSDLDKRKTNTMQSNKQHVRSYLAKNPELPNVQDYTIAYLEARMKKMENNLLNKIEENSQKIVDLKQTYAPKCVKKNVHTQTSISEDVHKRQLYQELSKYLSQEANSLVYEELFINQYAKNGPQGSSSLKRRRRR